MKYTNILLNGERKITCVCEIEAEIVYDSEVTVNKFKDRVDDDGLLGRRVPKDVGVGVGDIVEELQQCEQSLKYPHNGLDGLSRLIDYSPHMPQFCGAYPYFFRENLYQSVSFHNIPPMQNIEIIHKTLFCYFITDTHKN